MDGLVLKGRGNSVRQGQPTDRVRGIRLLEAAMIAAKRLESLAKALESRAATLALVAAIAAAAVVLR